MTESGLARRWAERARLVFGVVVLVVVLAVLLHDGSAGRSAAAPARPSTPTKVHIASLRLNAAVLPADTDPAQVLTRAGAPGVVDWWRGSARPGARSGQTVLVGTSGRAGDGGVLARLTALRRGSAVDVKTTTATVRYRVVEVRRMSGSELSTAAPGLVDQRGGAGRLVLVSSSGWTGAGYDDALVVLAQRVGTVGTDAA